MLVGGAPTQSPALGAGALGIGLLLSQATVERYGGRIELVNATGGGAEARLHLPLAGQNPT